MISRPRSLLCYTVLPARLNLRPCAQVNDEDDAYHVSCAAILYPPVRAPYMCVYRIPAILNNNALCARGVFILFFRYTFHAATWCLPFFMSEMQQIEVLFAPEYSKTSLGNATPFRFTQLAVKN